MDITSASAAALEEIEDHILTIAAGHPIVTQGEMFQELCVAFQGRAIFFLLNELDLSHYYWNLSRSVQARLFYLRKLHEQGGSDAVFTALSRTESLFVAIAMDDIYSAMRLRAQSAQSWMPDGEYEDDYWYYAFVHSVVEDNLDESRKNLNRMIVALGELEDIRVDLCSSFLEMHQIDFWSAFTEFIEDRHERALIQHDDGRLVGEPWLSAFQYVCIEAIAWLKLARTRGFQPPESEFRMCPSVVLDLPKIKDAPNIFTELESRFGL